MSDVNEWSGQVRDVFLLLPPKLDFDGKTFNLERDGKRLSAQLKRVVSVMVDCNWHLLSDIAAQTGDPQQSISARLRDCRKFKFGLTRFFAVQHEYIMRGLFRYRFVKLT